jgi:transcriptional regulator with XRE-family HTH domain
MGARIKKRRRELRITQTELAERVGVSRPTISELENGTRTTMTTDTAKALARALGISIDYLVGTWEDSKEEDEETTHSRGKKTMIEDYSGIRGDAAVRSGR